MKNIFKTLIVVAALTMVFNACNKQDYSMGDLTAPSNIVITTEVLGVDATHPYGDGSGDVKITVTADNALEYKMDFDANTALELKSLPKLPSTNTAFLTKKFTNVGVNTYRITAVVYGKGGVSSSQSASVTVRSDFTVDPAIVTKLTADASKTWVVDQKAPGHFGVGPIAHSDPNNLKDWTSPVWWAAAPDEKLVVAPCFYTTTFTFTKVSAKSYSLTVVCPDGAFTKTGDLAGGLPGIPSSGPEACYSYTGGTSDFAFVPASSGIGSPLSTQTSIALSGNNTYIGYGALQKEYEIFNLTNNYMYLRVQGTETGNAWYLKLKPGSN